MLSNEVVLEIRRFLDAGELSRRAIAEKLGVSRGVVANVANGRRLLRTRPIEEAVATIPDRCCQCGGLVYKPCRLCRTRAYQTRLAQLRREQGGGMPPRRVA